MKTEMTIYYFLPLLPIISRTCLCLIYNGQMEEHLEEAELDRDAHRNVILPLAGFSFTGVVGLIVLDPKLRLNYKIAIFYLMISFLTYLFSLNIQGYKTKRWHDLLSTGVMESGSLSLILAACYLIGTQEFGEIYAAVLIFISLGAWLTDHIIRLSIQWRYLKEKEKSRYQTKKIRRSMRKKT